MNVYDLKDRVAIVTGGAQGIGLAVATRILASGGKVCIWDRDKALLDETVKRIGKPDHVRGLTVDIADLATVEAATKSTLGHFGKIDILINNAAIVGPNANTWEYPPEAFRDVVNVGLIGTFYCCRTVVPTMIAANYGRIVNIASVAGKEGNPKAPAYSSMKAGVIALTKSLGKELAGYNIGVNCVTPAVAKTTLAHEPGAGLSGHDRCENSARPHARARRSGVDDLLPRQRRKFVHHRRGFRSLRRARDLLRQRQPPRMSVKLYYSPGACSLAPHIVLEEVGDRFELSRVDIASGQQNSPEYPARQPKGSGAGARRRRLGADRSAGDPALHRGAPSRGGAVALGAARGSALRRVAQLAVVDHSTGFRPCSPRRPLRLRPARDRRRGGDRQEKRLRLVESGRGKNRRRAVGAGRTLQRRRSAAHGLLDLGPRAGAWLQHGRTIFRTGPRMRAALPRGLRCRKRLPPKALPLPA